jgi:hypothetical protein
MTLTEYLNQETPVKFPKVFLRPDEFTVLSKRTSSTHLFKSLHINGIDAEYCLKVPLYEVKSGKWERLYTTDQDGNPNRQSVFHIRLTDEG